ncbi:hypothetical protein [Aquiflexum lacus]|uniref:hypothetical protein n=1 Tax=Aquiflexum lacus TaxID=2483805 RepID=UPI0018947DCE|nr:hypothetical protein [Aquiflexum lacus]
MKNQFVCLANVTIILLLMFGCGSEEKPSNKLIKYNLGVEIQENVFNEEVLSKVGNLENFLDLLTANGMRVSNGAQPPTIMADILKGDFGVRYTVESLCIYDGKNSSNVGEVFGGFFMEMLIDTEPGLNNLGRLRYSSLSSDNYPEYPNGIDSGEGSGYASGGADNFTLFVLVENARFRNIPYKALWIISGSYNYYLLTNFTMCFVILEKGNDPNDELANPGTIRIFSDPQPDMYWD